MTTDGNSDMFMRFIEREEAERKAEDYAKKGNYLPDVPPKKGWKRRQAVKLTLWIVALAVLDTGLVLNWIGGGTI